MKQTDEIEKLFLENFEQFEVVPPDELKANIDRQLVFNDGRSNKAIWWFGSLIALLMIGSVSAFIILSGGSEKKLATNTKQNKLAETSTHKQNANIATTIPEETAVNKTSIQNQVKKTTKVAMASVYRKGTSQRLKTHKKNITTSSKTTAFKPSKLAVNLEKPISNALTNPLLTSLTTTNIETEEKTLIRDEVNNAENRKTDEQKTENVTTETVSTQVSDSAEILRDEMLKNQESIPISTVTKKQFPLILSLSAGSYFALSHFNKKEVTAKEKNRLQVQLDVAYGLGKSKFSIQSGFNFRQASEQFSFKELVYDSLFYGTLYTTQEIVETEIYLEYANSSDTIQFTRIDTISTTSLYKENNRLEDRSVTIKTTSYSIPILLRYSKQIKNSPFYLDLSTGMSFNILNYKFIDQNSTYNNNLTYTKTGMNALVKSHLRYQFNKIGVSLNTNFVYDLKPVQFVDAKRNRFLIDMGVGLHYRF